MGRSASACFSPAPSATSSAWATRWATSACTWKTSVRFASNGCSHRVEPLATWISSGLTRTRLRPLSPFSHRTLPTSR